MALTHAMRTPDRGYLLGKAGKVPGRTWDIYVKELGYADDLLALASTKTGAQETAQAMVSVLGALNIRVQAKKCVTMHSTAAAEEGLSEKTNFEGCVVNVEKEEGGLEKRRIIWRDTRTTGSKGAKEGGSSDGPRTTRMPRMSSRSWFAVNEQTGDCRAITAANIEKLIDLEALVGEQLMTKRKTAAREKREERNEQAT